MTRLPSERPGRERLSRRRFLGAGLATAGVAALAGCGYRPGGGDVRWTVETGTGPYAPDFLFGGDRLLFAVDRSRRSYDFEAEEWGEWAYLTAYDPATGEQRWKRRADPVGPAAVRGDSLVVGHEDGALAAFDAEGNRRWRVPVGGAPRRVAAGPDRVYALTAEGDSSSAALHGVDLKRGETLWTRPLDAGGRRTFVASSAGVFSCSVVDDTDLSAVARSPAGDVRWRVERRAGRQVPGGHPVVADGALYVPTDDELVAFDAADGDEVWTAPVRDPRGPPAVAGGTVFQSGESLTALRASDGSERWSFEPADGRVATPPAATDEGVYVGGDRRLHALDAADGAVRWTVETESASDPPVVVGSTAVVRTRAGTLRGHRRN